MRVIKYTTRLTEDGRATLERESSVNHPGIDASMSSPEKVDILAREVLRLHEKPEEYLYMVCLNTKLRMTSVFELSHGNVNSSVVGIREMFQKALLANAVNVIVLHNHPSGDPSPSRQDIEVTKRMMEAGKILGIDVIDHLVIGRPGYCSIKEKGYL